jgi:hypothetical protein
MASPSDEGPALAFEPPLSSVPWSSDFVTQSLEALFVYLAPDGAHHLRPIHAETLRLGWGKDQQPAQILAEAVRRYGLRALLVHSTSWRHEQERVVLTYVVAVEPPDSPNANLADEPVQRTELARGDAFGPPPSIGVAQVLEHAFRHLAWLLADDAAVGEALAEWSSFLRAYEPEPFRAL